MENNQLLMEFSGFAGSTASLLTLKKELIVGVNRARVDAWCGLQ